MSQRKVKVSLTPKMSLGLGHLLRCCGKLQPVKEDSLDVYDYWKCVDCGEPLLLRVEEGYFLIGQNVTI